MGLQTHTLENKWHGVSRLCWKEWAALWRALCMRFWESLGREEPTVTISGQTMSKEPTWRGGWPGLKGQPLLLALNSDPELMIFMLVDQDSACGCPCTCATTLSMDICLVFCFVLFTKCFTCIHLSWIDFHSNSVNRRCSYFYCYFYFTKDKAGLWEVETLPNNTTTQQWLLIPELCTVCCV